MKKKEDRRRSHGAKYNGLPYYIGQVIIRLGAMEEVRSKPQIQMTEINVLRTFGVSN